MQRMIWAAAAASLALLTATPLAMAQPAPAAPQQAPDDALANPAQYKTPEVLAFIGVKRGARVEDVISGRFARALSNAVGPTGHVYAFEPAEVVKLHPEVLDIISKVAALPDYHNIEVATGPFDALALPSGLDAVFIRQNYHDLHDKFMGPADVAAFNKKVFAALKPGGVFVILDHAAPAGSGLADTDTLHRIDPAAVKSEVEAAGFVFDGSSDVLANPADPHDKLVFDPSIRGHTDQFLFRFKKPG
ncbi:MAG TPA: methyltransferase [Caulobacteraceae bacterium]|jgi:predicted methyltransferase